SAGATARTIVIAAAARSPSDRRPAARRTTTPATAAPPTTSAVLASRRLTTRPPTGPSPGHGRGPPRSARTSALASVERRQRIARGDDGVPLLPLRVAHVHPRPVRLLQRGEPLD